MVIDGELTFLTGTSAAGRGEDPRADREGGAPELLLERYAGRLEPHDLGTPTGRSRTFSWRVDAGSEPRAGGGGSSGAALVDNGEIGPGTHGFHLLPAWASKTGRVRAHARPRLRAQQCIAWATRAKIRRRASGGPLLSRGQCRGRRCPVASQRRPHRGADERGLLRGRDPRAGRVKMTRAGWHKPVYSSLTAAVRPIAARVRQHGRSVRGARRLRSHDGHLRRDRGRRNQRGVGCSPRPPGGPRQGHPDGGQLLRRPARRGADHRDAHAGRSSARDGPSVQRRGNPQIPDTPAKPAALAISSTCRTGPPPTSSA